MAGRTYRRRFLHVTIQFHRFFQIIVRQAFYIYITSRLSCETKYILLFSSNNHTSIDFTVHCKSCTNFQFRIKRFI